DLCRCSSIKEECNNAKEMYQVEMYNVIKERHTSEGAEETRNLCYPDIFHQREKNDSRTDRHAEKHQRRRILGHVTKRKEGILRSPFLAAPLYRIAVGI